MNYEELFPSDRLHHSNEQVRVRYLECHEPIVNRMDTALGIIITIVAASYVVMLGVTTGILQPPARPLPRICDHQGLLYSFSLGPGLFFLALLVYVLYSFFDLYSRLQYLKLSTSSVVECRDLRPFHRVEWIRNREQHVLYKKCGVLAACLFVFLVVCAPVSYVTYMGLNGFCPLNTNSQPSTTTTTTTRHLLADQSSFQGVGSPPNRRLLQVYDMVVDENFNDSSSDIEIAEESDPETIIDSVSSQGDSQKTLTPNMQSLVGNYTPIEVSERLLGPALGDQQQGSFSINLRKIAFHDSLRRLCSVQAMGNECGCLHVLAKMVMEQCVGKLDVAMFNATDPVSDPIIDSKVLPILAGDLSFGSGAQLKNSVGNWSDNLGLNADNSARNEKEGHENEESECFPLLSALMDLLMLPKDMLMCSAVRMEVCPSISLLLVKRVLCNSPDEALNAESAYIERRLPGESTSSFPYLPPSSSDVAEKVSKASDTNSGLSRSAPSVQKKGQ